MKGLGPAARDSRVNDIARRLSDAGRGPTYRDRMCKRKSIGGFGSNTPFGRQLPPIAAVDRDVAASARRVRDRAGRLQLAGQVTDGHAGRRPPGSSGVFGCCKGDVLGATGSGYDNDCRRAEIATVWGSNRISRVSTVAVQRFCKPKVGGSNPSPGTKSINKNDIPIASQRNRPDANRAIPPAPTGAVRRCVWRSNTSSPARTGRCPHVHEPSRQPAASPPRPLEHSVSPTRS